MSVTLINPTGEQSIQDNLWHIASSSNSGVTDMKYVFDVYYKGQQLVRTKIFPEPITGKGFFDASPIIKNEITYDWFTAQTGNIVAVQPSISGQIAATYQVFVGEDVSGVTTLNMASGQVTAYNYAPPTFKRKQFDLTNYNNRFLTHRPLKNYRVTLTDNIFVGCRSMINSSYFIVRGYDPNHNLLWAESFQYNENPTGNKFMQLNIGANNLNDLLFSYQITYAIDHYEVSVEDVFTEAARVYLDCAPTKYQPISLHFMNAFGMFDTAKFGLVSKWTTETERKTFEKRDYSFGTSSVNYYDANSVYKESKINYGSKTNSSYRLTMNFPTDEEYQWLSELIVSPQVYMELDEAFYPVSIKANNYEYSKNINNGLRAFEIDVDVNQKRFNYRR